MPCGFLTRISDKNIGDVRGVMTLCASVIGSLHREYDEVKIKITTVKRNSVKR